MSRTSCACGCGAAINAGRRFVHGHGRRRPVGERWWEKVDKRGPFVAGRRDLGRCWLWTAAKNSNGYGSFAVGAESKGAHRVGYEMLVGAVPAGMELDHLCSVRACVNPSHLVVATHRQNTLRSSNPMANQARQTECRRGHPFDLTRKDGRRDCSVCKAARRQREQAKRRL